MSPSPVLPESVVGVVCVEGVEGIEGIEGIEGAVEGIGGIDYGKSRLYVDEEKEKNPWFPLIVSLNERVRRRVVTAYSTTTTTTTTTLSPRLLLSSASPLSNNTRPSPSTCPTDPYDADEELLSDEEPPRSLFSPIPSLPTTTPTTTTTTTPTTTTRCTLAAANTPPKRWPDMPPLRARRSFSSKVHSLLYPPTHELPLDPDSDSRFPILPAPSPYATARATTTASSAEAEDGDTTGSDDFFSTSPHSLRLDEADSYLLDDDPDPFANYLCRARSCSSIHSSHLDHAHAHAPSHPLSAPAPAPAPAPTPATPTQPTPSLTRVPSLSSRASSRLSTTAPPTPHSSIRRQRLFTRPSLPSLVTLAQRFGASPNPTPTPLPTTNEDAALDTPILLPPSPSSSHAPYSSLFARFPVDPWKKHPDGAATSTSVSATALRGREAVQPLGYPPLVVARTNTNANARVNTYPQSPFSDAPNADVTHRPGLAAASSGGGSSSFVAGSGSGYGGPSSQQNQTHGSGANSNSNQHSYSQYSGGGMGGGAGGGRGGGGGSGGGGDRGDGDRDRDRARRPRGPKDAKAYYSSTEAATTTTEDEQGSTHARGIGNRSGNGNGTSDSDDTPLAHRLPGALTAQKSLRRLVKENRDMQRQTRTSQTRARAKSAPRPPIPPQLLQPQQVQVPTGDTSASAGRSLLADELTKKLLKVQSSSPSLPHTGSPAYHLGQQQQHTAPLTAPSTFAKYAFPATPSPRAHHWPDAYPITNGRGSESDDRHYPYTSTSMGPAVAPRMNTGQLSSAGNMDMTAFPQFPHSAHPPQQQQQQRYQQVTAHSLQRATTSAASASASQSRVRSRRPSHEMPEPRQRADTLVSSPPRSASARTRSRRHRRPGPPPARRPRQSPRCRSPPPCRRCPDAGLPTTPPREEAEAGRPCSSACLSGTCSVSRPLRSRLAPRRAMSLL
jgi:hypothetical protein